MKKALRLTALGLAGGLLGMQFVRSPRNDGAPDGPSSIGAQEAVPAPVKQILERACYDCHSNRTVYPWYASVQPVAWWLNKHIAEGKGELNFSEFSAYDVKRAIHKLESVSDQVHDREMPLKSYLLMHREARLTDAERALVESWADELADRLGEK
jgi:hypothetical protein